MKKYLYVTPRDLCKIGILTAITAILAMFFTFRVGNILKIPFKFISVFITGLFFGPVWAGISAAFGDILNALLMPVGAFMPQITLVEFISGFIYGIFLYDSMNSVKGYRLRVTACLIAQLLLDAFVTSFILTQSGIFPNLTFAITTRFPCAVLKIALQGIIIFPAKHYIKPLRRFIGK